MGTDGDGVPFVLRHWAHRQGFVLRLRGPGYPEHYRVCSTSSKHPAFIGTLRECEVWIHGYTFRQGER